MSSVDVVTQIEIRRPAADVAAFVVDPTKAPEWYENIVRAEWCTAPPVQVGSVFSFEARFLGRALSYDYEVVEMVPNDFIVMPTEHGPFPWRPRTGGSRNPTALACSAQPR